MVRALSTKELASVVKERKDCIELYKCRQEQNKRIKNLSINAREMPRRKCHVVDGKLPRVPRRRPENHQWKIPYSCSPIVEELTVKPKRYNLLLR